MAVNPHAHTHIRKIWPDIAHIHDSHYEHWLKYVEFLSAKVFEWSADANGLRAPFRCATTSLDTTLDLVGILRDMRAQRWGPQPRIDCIEDMTRAEIVAKIKADNLMGLSGQPHDDILNAVCLAISIWTSVEIGPKDGSEWFVFEKVNQWTEHMTLSQLLSNTFPTTPPPSALNTQAMIHPKLTMEYLCTFHKFDWKFTQNLSEHLEIRWASSDNNKPTLMIYKHKVFLRNERKEHLLGHRRSKLPIDLVEEALDTLNLLFPYDDRRTRRILGTKDREADFHDLAWCGRGRSLDLRRYAYWGERIMQLSEISKGELLGFSQLKADRDGRNLMQAMNFWTAIWVAVLTIVSIVIGGLSIKYAVLAYEVSVSSYEVSKIAYELALAQACAVPDAGAQLPQFCPGNVSAAG